VRTRAIGNSTVGIVEVGAVGLGEMPLSVGPRPAQERAIATIHAALDAGVSLIDTADVYCAGPDDVGHGERLVATALAAYGGPTGHVLVTTKGGHLAGRLGDGIWKTDGSPAHLRRACDSSLAALGVDAIGLYQHHRPDPAVPYADSMGALRELYDAGKVRMLGISNADTDQIKIAQAELGDALVSVQNQYAVDAPNFRNAEQELAYCAAAGLAFLPYSSLGGIHIGRGLGDRLAPFADIAAEHGVSPQRVCIAWTLAKAPVVVAIPGASRPETIRDSAAATDLTLTAEQLARIDAIADAPAR
jgi:aryl-alcohol dehydrogenase-like predicted oxidoreductase